MSVSGRIVDRPVLVAIVFALIAILGLFLLPTLAIDLMPEVSQPVLSVMCSYSGASPETMETKVTRILEGALNAVEGLKTITSTSSEGSSSISLEFEFGTDLEAAKNDIRDKLERVIRSLPDDADRPSISKFDPNSQPIVQISVRGNRSAEEIKSLAENILQPLFEQAAGVAQVTVRGGRTRIVRVDLEQNRLDAYGLSITGISSVLAAQNASLGGGSVREGTLNYQVRTEGGFTSLDDIADTVIATVNGAQVRLRDVGEVSDGFEDPSSYARIDGKEGVYLAIQKQSGTNTVRVADAIFEKLEAASALVPADISMKVMRDSSKQVRDTLNDLVESAAYGGILAMLILFLFLRNLKSTLVMGVSIPFSILVTMLCMFFAGITLNMMTLTGLILGVGMVVDASIVMLENIYAYRDRGAKPRIAAILGSHEMLSAITSSTLTSVCVFIPILFFKSRLGFFGELFEDLIFTIGIALLSSLFVAVFLVPVLASKYLVFKTRTQKPLRNPALKAADDLVERLLGLLNAAYEKALGAALRHRGAVVALVVFVFLGCVALVPFMNIQIMPRMAEDSVTLSVALPLGTDLETTNQVVLQFEEFVRNEVQGAEDVTASVGGGGRSRGTYSGSVSFGFADGKGSDTPERAQAKLRAHFPDFPQARFSFGRGMFRQATGSDIDLVLRVQDLDIGLSAANEIVEVLEREVPDVLDWEIGLTEGLPEAVVVIDRERLYALGLNARAVANEIYASVYGSTATAFTLKGEEIPVRLFLDKADRDEVLDLERLFVKNAAGQQVAVSNFARPDKGSGPVSIRHENRARVIHVEGSIGEGRRADRVEAAIKRAIAENLVIDDSVSIAYEGSWKQISENNVTFALIFAMAVILVFGVMAGQYESFKDPLINLLTIPLMFIGVILIYAVSAQPVTLFNMVGLVMLAGIVVNNGIVLVDYTNLLHNRGVPLFEACLKGGVSRLRPILMTTLTTILGTLPMAISSGENAGLIKPIGLTIIGGLTTSTFITLFFIPVVYYLVNGKRERRRS